MSRRGLCPDCDRLVDEDAPRDHLSPADRAAYAERGRDELGLCPKCFLAREAEGEP